MSYDRDEWRRPWRAGEGPIGSWTAPAVDAPTLHTDESTSEPVTVDRPRALHTDDEPSTASDPAGATEASAAPATFGDVDGPAPGEMTQPPSGDVTQPLSASTTQRMGMGAAQPMSEVPSQLVTPSLQPPPPAWEERIDDPKVPHQPHGPHQPLPPPEATGSADTTRRQRGRSPIVLLVVAIIGGVIGAAAFAGISELTESEQETPAAVDREPSGGGTTTDPAPTVPDSDVSAGPYGVVPAVAEAVTPSVVRIDITGGGAGGPQAAPVGLGSGVIYRSDGYILTNHHVINGAQDVTVRLSSGDVLDAEIIGSDELNDLAVLRVAHDDLPAVTFRSEDEPMVVGEMVVAIGSPFGLDASVTTGVISALNREIQLDEQDMTTGAVLTIPSVIQTDAAINPGNSGGALVDGRGRLVGVNTAILTRSGASQGVGFAVSAEQALVSAEQLIDQGFVRHPLLGISGADVTVDIAEQFELAASRGAVVESVQEDSGAALAGVRPGDIIVEIDEEPLSTMSQLVAEVRRREPGETVTLGIVRGGQELTVEVELGERPR